MFDALDVNLQQNLLNAIPNDADHTPKPQRFQDFLKVCAYCCVIDNL